MEKLRTQRTFILQEKDIEKVDSSTETVPSETMTIREILDKFSRGQRIDAAMRRDGKFEENSNFDSEDLEAASRASLTDRDEIVDRMRESNDAGVADLKRRQESAAAKKLATQKANEQKKLDSENKSEEGKPPGSAASSMQGERGATGGKASV